MRRLCSDNARYTARRGAIRPHGTHMYILHPILRVIALRPRNSRLRRSRQEPLPISVQQQYNSSHTYYLNRAIQDQNGSIIEHDMIVITQLHRYSHNYRYYRHDYESIICIYDITPGTCIIHAHQHSPALISRANRIFPSAHIFRAYVWLARISATVQHFQHNIIGRISHDQKSHNYAMRHPKKARFFKVSASRRDLAREKAWLRDLAVSYILRARKKYSKELTYISLLHLLQ